MNSLYLIASFFAFTLSGLLLSKKDKLRSNLYLSLFLSAFGIQIIMYYTAREIGPFYGLLNFRGIFSLLYGPLIYFYTCTLTDKQFKFKLKSCIHFLPFILIAVFNVFYFYFPYNIQNINNYSLTIFYNLGKYIVISSVIFYIIKSLQQLSKYQKAIADNYSFTEKINLRWLNNFIYGFLLIWIIIWGSLSLNKIVNFISPYDDSFFIYLFMSLYIILLGIFGIRQTHIFSNINIPETDLSDKKNELDKVVKKEKNWEVIFERIDALIKNEKLFLEPLLTIDDIAKKLSVNSNYISNAINNAGNSTFFEYINRMRIDEFKKQLSNPENENFTILAIAFNCGYNSRSSFNRIFKNLTGQTPSQYKSSVKPN